MYNNNNNNKLYIKALMQKRKKYIHIYVLYVDIIWRCREMGNKLRLEAAFTLPLSKISSKH